MEQEMQRALKRTANWTVTRIFIYMVVMNGVSALYFIGAQLFFMATSSNPGSQEMYDALYHHLTNSAMSMILGVVIGFLILWALMHSRISLKSLFVKTEKKMTVKSFFVILCVFLSAQVVFSIVAMGMEAIAKLLGYSLMAQIESATVMTTTVSVLLYSSLVAPVFEELVFRGFMLRGMQPLGRRVAVIVSAITFGIYHMNLPQGVFAIYMGIVLGYVAINYSIWWAIALHVLNNSYAAILTVLEEQFSLTRLASLSSSLFIIIFVFAIILLIKKREEIKEYMHQEKSEKGHLRCALTSWSMILTIILGLGMALSFVTKL